MSDEVKELTVKYYALSAAIESSLKSYRAYYDGVLKLLFNDDGTMKTSKYVDKKNGDILEVPLAAILEYPKLMQISNIHLKSDDLDTATEIFPEGCTPADARHLREGNFDMATEIQELKELVLTAWETIEEAGYQGHNEELKEKVEELQSSI